MTPYVAFHLGLDCLPKYLFTVIQNALNFNMDMTNVFHPLISNIFHGRKYLVLLYLFHFRWSSAMMSWPNDNGFNL